MGTYMLSGQRCNQTITKCETDFLEDTEHLREARLVAYFVDQLLGGQYNDVLIKEIQLEDWPIQSNEPPV